MQRIESQIRAVRVQTNNEDYAIPTQAGDPGSGVQDSTIARHLTAAQRRIHGLILDRRPSAFVKEAFLSTIAGQESYTLPSDAHVSQSMLSVELSSTGQLYDYSPLDLKNFKERNTSSGLPTGYIPRNGAILLNPIPQSGITNAIRINYQYDLPEVSCRVAEVNLNTTFGSDLHLYADSTLNSIEIAQADYYCIVDKDGLQVAIGLALDVYVDSGAEPILTVDIAPVLPGGGPYYVVVGKNTTTHSQLNDFCEDYLIAFASWRLLKGDANATSAEAIQELKDMENTIVEKYAQQNDDVEYPTILSDDYWS